MSDAGLFGPASAAWKIDRERAVLLGGTRSLLMQVAHPRVARGVAEHSDFRGRPFRRLARTLTLTLDSVFGDTPTALRAVRRINATHAVVRGSGYSAFDEDLLVWVMATLVDSAVLAYEIFVGELTATEKDAYYAETRAATRLLGMPPMSAPSSFASLRRYVDEMVASGEVRVERSGLELGLATLYPPAAWYLPRPVKDAVALLTAGLLPPALREQYALPWSRRHRAAFELLARSARAVVPRLPARLRYVPQALAATRRVA